MSRAMTVDDVDQCVDLFVAVFADPPWSEIWTPGDARQRLADMLATPRSCGVVLDDGAGTPSGFALGHCERFRSEDHFLLQEMCVAATRRRQGLGSRLLEGLADRLPDVRHWHLLTARESPAAAFYARHGFREAGRMGVFVRP